MVVVEVGAEVVVEVEVGVEVDVVVEAEVVVVVVVVVEDKIIMKRFLVAALWFIDAFLVNCGDGSLPSPRFDKIDGQDRIIVVVWSSYGRIDSPPEIGWIEGPDLNCDGAAGFILEKPRLMCSYGTYNDGDDFVRVAQSEAHWREALAHELAHVVQYRTVGHSDHSQPWFDKPTGSPEDDGPLIRAATESIP